MRCLLTGDEKVTTVHPFHVVLCGIVPLVSDEVLVEEVEKQLHVMRQAAA